MTFGATDIVRLVLGIVFGALMLCLLLVFALNRTPKARFQGAMKVIGVFALGLAGAYYVTVAGPEKIARQEALKKGEPSQQEYPEKYAKAKALFDERCKTAGEKIYKTADGVEGVLLLNVRSSDIAAQRANPNWTDAGLPDELGGDDYIRTFLSWEHQQFPPRRGYLNSHPTNRSGYLIFPGYSFVDVKEDAGIYRYAFRKPPDNALSKSLLSGKPAQYAVLFRNLTDEMDRAMWVAGTIITVTNTHTNEVMAEYTGYSFEPGQGNTDGARAPWGFAKTCPELAGWRGGATRMFVDKVLKPKEG